MTARAVLVLVVCAGCTGDPSVSVRFEVPELYRDLVDGVSLEVLAGDPLDCDAVALGNASDEDQATARLTEALVREPGDEAPLTGIPRTGAKLFVARALSDSGQLIAGGCAEAGTIDGDLEVVISGEPALTLGGRDTPSSGGPLPGELTALVSDARGQPVEDVTALQTVYAAAATELPGEPATSGKGGVLRFEVAQPDWAGPQVLDVDVRWQANERDQYAGFMSPFARGGALVPSPVEETLPVRALYQVGHLGPGGEMGVAVLGRVDGTGKRPVHIYVYDPDDDSFSGPATSAPLPVRAIGLVEGSSLDTIVAMDRDTWYTIDPDGTVHPVSKPGLLDAAALASLSDCTPDGKKDQLLVVGDGGLVALYDASGKKLDDWQDERPEGVGELLAAGCVRGLEKTYRAAVFTVESDSSPRPFLAIDADGSQPAPVNAAVERGLAFTPVLASGDGPYLLANRFENDGISIARYTAVPIEGAPTFLDQRDEDDIAGLSESSAGGDFDGDGLLDVAAMVTVPLGDGRVAVRFFVALGILVEDQRLFGLGATGIDDPDFAPLLLAADFDGDRIDDLFLATSQAFSVFELEPE